MHAIAAFDQTLQQLELGRRQLDLFAVGRHAVRCAVEDDRSADQAAAGGDGRRGEAT